MICTLRLDQAALHVIGEALGQMPHRAVAALIATVQRQVNAQESAAASVFRLRGGQRRHAGGRRRARGADARTGRVLIERLA
jgi:hypothetical protein